MLCRFAWSCSPGSWHSLMGWWKTTCWSLFWRTSERGATWPSLSSTKSTTLTSASCHPGCWIATTTVSIPSCQACRRNQSRKTGENKNYKLFTISGQSAETEERLVSCSVSSRLFTKLVLEAPVITESALEVIRRYCEDEVSKIMTGLSYRSNPH